MTTKGVFVIYRSVRENRPKVAEGERVERRLRALEERLRHELLGEDERCELRERVLRLRAKAGETVDLHHSCLERAGD